MGCNCNGCPNEDIAPSVMVMVEVPEGVVMDGEVTGGGVTAEFPLPQPTANNTEHRKAAVRALLHAKRLALRAQSNIRRFRAVITRIKANARSGRIRIPAGGAKSLGIKGSSAAPPLVDTVTVNGTGVPLTIATVAGTWHVAPRGAPLQANDTVPL